MVGLVPATSITGTLSLYNKNNDHQQDRINFFLYFLVIGCSKSNNDYDKSHEYIHFFPTDQKSLSISGKLANFVLLRDNYFEPGECKKYLDKINEQKIKNFLIATNQAEGRNIKAVSLFCYLDTKKENQDCIDKIANKEYNDQENEIAISFARTLGLCRTTEIVGGPKAILLN